MLLVQQKQTKKMTVVQWGHCQRSTHTHTHIHDQKMSPKEASKQWWCLWFGDASPSIFYTTLHLVLDGDGHCCCALVRLTEDWQKQRDERNAHRVSMFEQVLLDNHSSSSSPFAENAAANGREHTHWLSGFSFSCTDNAATSQREEEHTGTDTNWSIDSLPPPLPVPIHRQLQVQRCRTVCMCTVVARQ